MQAQQREMDGNENSNKMREHDVSAHLTQDGFLSYFLKQKKKWKKGGFCQIKRKGEKERLAFLLPKKQNSDKIKGQMSKTPI